MLLVILRSTKFSLKKTYTPEYFKYKDLIMVIVDWEKETAYRLDLYYKNLIKFSLKQENWFNYKLNGERKIKNFHGAKVKVFAFNNSLFNTVDKNPITGNLELIDGVEGYLFNEISRLTNIKIEVIVPINNSDKWGIRLPNGSYTLGATRRLQTKVVDIALASLWIEYFKINSVEMSHYWSEECLKLLVPKPPLTRNKWDLLFKPFPLSIWLLLFAVTLLNILTLWIVAVIQRKIKYKHIDAFTSLSSSIFWLLGIMFLASFPVHTHRLGPIRHLLNWWCIFIFIIAIAFSSVLYSYITSPEYTNLATSIEEMEKEDYTWGGLIDHATWTFVLKIENPIHKKFSVRFIPEKSIAERIDRLVNGKYAVCTKFINGKYFMEMQDLPPYLLSDLRTSRECLNSFYIGIGFTKNSPFLKPANIVIRHLLESGIINYWMNRIFEKKLPLNTFDRIFEQKPLAEKDSGPSPLTFDQYKVVIVVWLIGCILSSTTFIFELKYGKVCVKDKKKKILSRNSEKIPKLFHGSET
ncbi:glutamate receptor ionotropic, kainate glr-3 isoform X2 [Daktulosphaira vitifoliae]|nr:glutamate receptor ionotropic, kainate glr-3 isoform X2 [Daktulosphaira vitifoliae]